MGLYKNFVSQTRKPEGFLGQMMVNGMNSGHAKMADWGMAHLKTIAPEEILEVGCVVEEMHMRLWKSIRHQSSRLLIIQMFRLKRQLLTTPI